MPSPSRACVAHGAMQAATADPGSSGVGMGPRRGGLGPVEKSAQRVPLAHPGRVDFQQLRRVAPRSVRVPQRCARGTHRARPAGFRRRRPDSHACRTSTRASAGCGDCVEPRAAFDPALVVAHRQDVSRVRKLRVDLAPQVEIRVVRERVEEIERRQPVVAGFDLPQQRLAVVGARDNCQACRH